MIKSPFSFKRKPPVWFSLVSGRGAFSLSWFVQTVGPVGMSAQRGAPRVNPGRCPHPAQVLLAQCVVYLARAPKSVEVYSAYNNVKACLRGHQGLLPPVPLHLRNAPTRLMKDLGYGQGYKYNPACSEPVEQDYLPQELRGVDFFKQRRC